MSPAASYIVDVHTTDIEDVVVGDAAASSLTIES